MDFVNWRIASDKPVIRPGQLHGSLDARRAGAPHIIVRGGRYYMVYWGTDIHGHNHILAAESPISQPNAWVPLGPLIGPQPGVAENCNGPGFPFLLPVDERYWILYYCGWGYRPDGRLPNTTGAAVSEDAGHTWRYVDRHPILPLDRPYDQQATGSLWVTHDNGRFRMWYTAIASYQPRPANTPTGHGDIIPQIGIAYAESDDGLHWRKPLDHWVIQPRGFNVEPYEYITSKPAMLVDNVNGKRRYTMWVNTFGTAYRVHHLTSTDGIDWQWAPRVGPEGELPPSSHTEAFDNHQRSYPVIVRHGGELRCWYTGNGFGTTGIGYAEGEEGSFAWTLEPSTRTRRP